jgi:histidyl-tRNA synthetase
LHTNPLRILDTKNPAMQALVHAAPRLMDHLGEASLAHFNGLRAILDANGIAYTVNTRLVRGMDYYNLSVFEFVTDQLGSQGTVCAGGRYDGLIGQIGGKPAPAVGWALGMERILELLKSTQLLPAQPVPDVFAVVPDVIAWPTVSQVLRVLRQQGLKVQMHAGGPDGMGSMKSQFKKADGSGARYALVFGQDELAQGMVSIKPLRASDGRAQPNNQRLASVVEAANWASTLMA